MVLSIVLEWCLGMANSCRSWWCRGTIGFDQHIRWRSAQTTFGLNVIQSFCLDIICSFYLCLETSLLHHVLSQVTNSMGLSLNIRRSWTHFFHSWTWIFCLCTNKGCSFLDPNLVFVDCREFQKGNTIYVCALQNKDGGTWTFHHLAMSMASDYDHLEPMDELKTNHISAMAMFMALIFLASWKQSLMRLKQTLSLKIHTTLVPA